MKKIAILFVCFLMTLMITGCGNKINVFEGELSDFMTNVYEGISEENLPMMLENIEITKENQVSYIGEADFEYEEAIASESGIGSIAHSVVLIRMSDDVTAEEIETAKKELKDNVDPRKWLCVGVEEVKVESNGNLILVVLNDDQGDTIIENFKNLK